MKWPIGRLRRTGHNGTVRLCTVLVEKMSGAFSINPNSLCAILQKIAGPVVSRMTRIEGNFLFLENTMSRTPNDDRSDSLNPNNPAYQHAEDNHADQLNPNNERYQGERVPDEE